MGAAVDPPELQGRWKVVSVSRDGVLLPKNGGYTGVLIHDNKILFERMDAEVRTSAYRTNPWKTPKHFDIYDEKGEKPVVEGIYDLNKEILRICEGTPRPTEFKTNKGDGRTLFVLKRQEESRTNYYPNATNRTFVFKIKTETGGIIGNVVVEAKDVDAAKDKLRQRYPDSEILTAGAK